MQRRKLSRWALAASTLALFMSVALVAPATADAPAMIKADFIVTDYPGDPLEDQHITVKAKESGKGKLTWDAPFKGWADIDPADVELPPDTDMKAYGKELWFKGDVECTFVMARSAASRRPYHGQVQPVSDSQRAGSERGSFWS